MIKVRISGTVREFQNARDIEESWINQQINRRRADDLPVCVQITIETESAYLVLATAGCQSGGGGGRPPNSAERTIFDAWQKHRFNDNGFQFHGGHVVAFLKEVFRMLR